MAISPKQHRFVDEYAIDLNATQAYKRAGYNVRSDAVAHACAAKLLRKPAIREKIDAGLRALAEATGMRAKEAFAILVTIARGNISNLLNTTGPQLKLLPANEVTEAAWRSAKTIECKRFVDEDGREFEIIEFRLESRVPALVLILKAHGKLKRPTVHTGPGGGMIEVEAEGTLDARKEEIASFVEAFRDADLRTLQEKAEAEDAAYAESIADEGTAATDVDS